MVSPILDSLTSNRVLIVLARRLLVAGGEPNRRSSRPKAISRPGLAGLDAILGLDTALRAYSTDEPRNSWATLEIGSQNDPLHQLAFMGLLERLPDGAHGASLHEGLDLDFLVEHHFVLILYAI